jgi:ATP-binding cassette subfamily C (CFTR/MRP) protein 4
MDGSKIYLGQKPWLITGTIKENILVNKPYEPNMFKNAIMLSGLADDIVSFQEGINKHVGEGGETLSGGQRARVALAMCIYQDSDILLLDDPVSALDANVAAYVMENTFIKELKGKTRILVTHSMQHLKYADHIYALDDGKIMISGNYDDFKGSELMLKFFELNNLDSLAKLDT